MIPQKVLEQAGIVIDIGANDEPSEHNFIIPGLEKGDVGIVAAPGGTGKSFLLLEIAMSVALGVTLIPGLTVNYAGYVRVLNFEERLQALKNRLIWICRYFGVDFPSDRLLVSSLSNCTLRLVDKNGNVNREYVSFLKKQAEGMSLLILDPLRMCHFADENDAGAMSALVQVLKDIGEETDAGVLVAHHSSKASILNGQGNVQQSVRGSSALVDAARLVITLSRPKNGESNLLELSWVKINSHPPIEPVTLMRVAGGVLVSAKLEHSIEIISSMKNNKKGDGRVARA